MTKNINQTSPVAMAKYTIGTVGMASKALGFVLATVPLNAPKSQAYLIQLVR